LALPLAALQYNAFGPIWAELRASEASKLEEIRKSFEDRGLPISVSFEEGDPAHVIHAAARAPDVELIVMGSHGLSGIDRTLIGSVADRTLRGSPVPVLIVREDESSACAPVDTILLATDFSENARQLEPVVARWAKRLRAEVEVLHVVPDTTVLFVPYAVPASRIFDEEVLESANRRVRSVVDRFRVAGVTAKPHIAFGYSSYEIVKRAESTGAKVIAMGSRGHSGLRRFRLGSVVQNVLADAPCSVLVGTESSVSGED
jgi:nucleotide-binding universal stress UspA family protein